VFDASSSRSKADGAIDAVDQTVAKVCDMLTCPANELVADQLMRIKGSATSSSMGMTATADLVARQNSKDALPNLPETGQAMEGTNSDAGMISSASCSFDQPSNPGSLGHPELCLRPCLYFAQGQCANGNSCEFCHRSHPKRPSHLDKRHREMLKRMPFVESVSVALPVLREKAQSISLGNNVMEILDELEEVASRILVNGDHGDGSSSRQLAKIFRRSRNLQGAMRGITMRSLLTILHHSDLAGDAISVEHAALADLLQSLRSAAIEFQCERF